MKMATGVHCPIGMDIDTNVECEDALLWAFDLGINMYSSRSSSVYSGSWGHVPYKCSYQSGGDLTYHFNSHDSGEPSDFLSGTYKKICRKGIG